MLHNTLNPARTRHLGQSTTWVRPAP